MRPLFLLALLFLVSPALAAADCPPAHYISTYIPAHDFPGAQLDTALVAAPSESVSVHYDLAQGSAFLRRVASLGSGGASLDLVDDYTITGVPDGTPVSFDAKLAAYGNAPPSGPHGPAWRVTLGSDASSVIGGNVYQNWSQVLTLPLNVTAGTPFRVHFLMEIFGGFDSFEQNEGAAIHFDGMPPGTAVSSCHGYIQGAVPTATATWGSLKAQYR